MHGKTMMALKKHDEHSQATPVDYAVVAQSATSRKQNREQQLNRPWYSRCQLFWYSIDCDTNAVLLYRNMKWSVAFSAAKGAVLLVSVTCTGSWLGSRLNEESPTTI